jgi:hypothetical protein
MNTHRLTGLVTGLAAGFALVAAAGMWLATPVPANAAIYYPWCAVYSGSGTGGGTNCYFANRQQCMETIRGAGGVCEPNGFYDAARAEERAVPKTGPKRRH